MKQYMHAAIWYSSKTDLLSVCHLRLFIISLIIICYCSPLLNETRKYGFVLSDCLVVHHLCLLFPTSMLGGHTGDVDIHARTAEGVCDLEIFEHKVYFISWCFCSTFTLPCINLCWYSLFFFCCWILCCLGTGCNGWSCWGFWPYKDIRATWQHRLAIGFFSLLWDAVMLKTSRKPLWENWF